MHCSTCQQALNPYVRDTLQPGEESTDFVVQFSLSPDYEDYAERMAFFKREGFWAASMEDAEIFTGRAQGVPQHDVISADDGRVLIKGSHASVLA